MKSPNAVISIILLAFSAFYGVLTWRLPSRDLPHTIGAAFLPWVLTGCLVFLSLMLLAGGLSLKSGEASSRSMLSLKEVGGIAGLLLVIGLYIFSMDYVGFTLGSASFLAVLTVIAGARRILEVAIFAVVTSFAIYFLFQHFFGVPLPKGVIF